MSFHALQFTKSKVNPRMVVQCKERQEARSGCGGPSALIHWRLSKITLLLLHKWSGLRLIPWFKLSHSSVKALSGGNNTKFCAWLKRSHGQKKHSLLVGYEEPFVLPDLLRKFWPQGTIAFHVKNFLFGEQKRTNPGTKDNTVVLPNSCTFIGKGAGVLLLTQEE